MENSVKIMKKRQDAIIPKRATKGAAGMDLYAIIDEPVTIHPGKLIVIPTGIAIELPSNEHAAFIFARSGLGVKHGIALSNGVGVIDSDYRGEICVGLCNLSDQSYTIQPKDRVAQMVIMPVCQLPLVEVNELDSTQRGEGGFGSTGKN